ncbi:3-(methylthio)propionyl-CoA ligase [Paracoccus sp. (in: a-proteobacteria)]|uniref:3-(methylthio)propionyl-CoA ligase n=1 Tax=Paracoccus sp. TaxID=267 RepID=UPI003A85117C
MLGQMMRMPLLISALLTHAERHHGEREIVSRRVEGDLHRYRYCDLGGRSRQLARALDKLGIRQGDRVGTLAWNGYRHMELYYAVSGSGAILHTINPRLHPDQILWIADHAGDRVLFFDLTFMPLIEQIAGRAKGIEVFVAMCDRDSLPDSGLVPNLICHEDLIAAEADDFEWPELDENAASTLCYTSGTTGHPKGVLYSHRSAVLHSLASAQPDMFNLSARDAILPVVPMFHVNAWGLPYTACMVGAKLVFPGPWLDGQSLHRLIEDEGVTMSAGVPTVWQGLLAHVESTGGAFSSMRRTIIGGAACPPQMIRSFQDRHDVRVIHAWGMTELSPLGTVCTPKPGQEGLSGDAMLALQTKQGRMPFGIDMKITGASGKELPHDGAASGELLVRGHWVAGSYFRQDADGPLQDGWFPTGDISTIDADGFMQITDRSKDLIKSGGEWISSIDLENIAAAHPGVALAACIAVPHPKWDERPVLVLQRQPGAEEVTASQILDLYQGKIARWSTPDDVIFIDAMPVGATGKILKAELRARYRDHDLTSANT